LSNPIIKNNYIKNSFWLLLEKVSRIISGVLVGVLVARFLGPADFGLINYALSVVAIFTIISTLGLDGLVVRELITRKNQEGEILGTAFLLRLIGAFFVVGIATYYSSLRDSSDRVWVVFIVGISIVFQSLTVIDFYFQSQVKGRFTAMSQVITLTLSAIVKIFLIVIKARVEWFAAMAVLEALISVICQISFYKSSGHTFKNWKFSFSEAKHLLIYSWPIILSAFMQMIYQKSDQILILRFLHEMNLVGQYAAAIRVSEASYFIPVAISAAVLPGIVNMRDNDELRKKRLTQLLSLMIWTAVVISLGGMLLGDWVINLFYKEKFYMAAGVFKIHIWITIPVFFGTVWYTNLLATNKQWLLLIFQPIYLVTIIGMQFFLIPAYGIKGAAWAVILGYYLGMFLTLLLYKPRESFGILFAAINFMHIKDIITYWRENKGK